MLSIDKKLLNTNNYLTYIDDQYIWTGEVPGYVYSDNSDIGPYSVEPLLKIFGYELPRLIEDKYYNMISDMHIKNPNWKMLLGNSYINKLKENTGTVISYLGGINNKKYIDFYRMTNEWLWELKPAELDKTLYNGIMKVDESFKLPLDGENIEVVRYDRSVIKTGRLSVISGPSIMNMKKERRNLVKDGLSIDFDAMEPRLLLNLMNLKVDGDIYEWVAKKCKLNGDRTYWKTAVISSLYGANIAPEVNSLFALKEWINQIEKSIYIDKNNRRVIDNYFGRPIVIEDATEHHLLNLWLQSSAAEFAMVGFMNIFRNDSRLIPHWVIHDGCIYTEKEKDVNIPKEIIIENMIFSIHRERL